MQRLTTEHEGCDGCPVPAFAGAGDHRSTMGRIMACVKKGLLQSKHDGSCRHPCLCIHGSTARHPGSLPVQQRQSPTPDLAGSIRVRVVGMAAGHAVKHRLRAARCGVDMAAGRAGPAGVAGIDRDHAPRLVVQHCAQGSFPRDPSAAAHRAACLPSPPPHPCVGGRACVSAFRPSPASVPVSPVPRSQWNRA